MFLNNGFNPRTREGCDKQPNALAKLLRVSIHAPVKGATSMSQIIQAFDSVSIHAPVKGATDEAFREAVTDNVSIHAPVKGATAL